MVEVQQDGAGDERRVHAQILPQNHAVVAFAVEYFKEAQGVLPASEDLRFTVDEGSLMAFMVRNNADDPELRLYVGSATAEPVEGHDHLSLMVIFLRNAGVPVGRLYGGYELSNLLSFGVIRLELND